MSFIGDLLTIGFWLFVAFGVFALMAESPGLFSFLLVLLPCGYLGHLEGGVLGTFLGLLVGLIPAGVVAGIVVAAIDAHLECTAAEARGFAPVPMPEPKEGRPAPQPESLAVPIGAGYVVVSAILCIALAAFLGILMFADKGSRTRDYLVGPGAFLLFFSPFWIYLEAELWWRRRKWLKEHGAVRFAPPVLAQED